MAASCFFVELFMIFVPKGYRGTEKHKTRQVASASSHLEQGVTARKKKMNTEETFLCKILAPSQHMCYVLITCSLKCLGFRPDA